MMLQNALVLDPPNLLEMLQKNGFARLSAEKLQEIAGGNLAVLMPFWENLPSDEYLRDGGRYRFRRHGCFIQEKMDAENIKNISQNTIHTKNTPIKQTAPRPHWQPKTYNALHGGMERWFAPLEADMTNQPVWQNLLAGLGEIFSAASGHQKWHIEAHAFRINTADGVGRPTPEGAHRDGVDYVAVIMVNRVAISGGETRVFEQDGAHGVRFTLTESWSALLLDDQQVIHESTPIQPLPDSDRHHRDTLVITYRHAGFQAA